MSVDDLKKILKIHDNEQDNFLKSLLLQSKAIVERKLGYPLVSKEYKEVHDIENASIFFVQAPILEIKSISGGTLKRYQKNAIYLQKKTTGEVLVHYTGGMEKIPEAISGAILNLAKELYHIATSNGLDIKSKKIDTLSISYFSPEEQKNGSTVRIESDLNAVLAPYMPLLCYAV